MTRVFAWVASPRERQDEWGLISNQFRNAENVVKGVRVREHSYPRSRQRHEANEVCGKWGVMFRERHVSERPKVGVGVLGIASSSAE
jgi:hypothetical protein